MRRGNRQVFDIIVYGLVTYPQYLRYGLK